MERKLLALLYKDPVRHQERSVCCQARSRTGGLSLQQDPEKGWCMAVSRGMGSSPFEGIPRQLGTPRTPWNECAFQGGVFSVYQKELSGTCGERDSVLQSCSPVETHTKQMSQTVGFTYAGFKVSMLNVVQSISLNSSPYQLFARWTRKRPKDQMELGRRFHSYLPRGKRQ